MSRFIPKFEVLENREVPAVISVASAGVLFVRGDQADNQILVAADTTGQITVNGTAVTGATRDSIGMINVQGRGGDDSITLDRTLNTVSSTGSLLRSPDSQVYGGSGDDYINILNGGIVGGLAGVINGVVVGPVVGNNYTEGGAGDDTFISGFGEDTFLGQSGDDTYVWNPGTIDDRFDGGSGRDTATIIGNNNASDAFSLSVINKQLVFQRTNLINFTVTMDRVEQVNLDPGSGADNITIGALHGVGLKTVQVVVADAGDTVTIAPQRGGIGFKIVPKL
jgi:Ca2+-binding RTX toxin-like protein